MPSRETLRRLSALEGQAKKHTGSDPSRIYRALLDHGLEAPEPQPGEDTQAWLARVPAASLEALLEREDAYAQS